MLEKPNLRPFYAALIVAILLWTVSPVISSCVAPLLNMTAAGLGDSFGSVNALASTLVMFLAGVALYFQRLELSQISGEMNRQTLLSSLATSLSVSEREADAAERQVNAILSILRDVFREGKDAVFDEEAHERLLEGVLVGDPRIIPQDFIESQKAYVTKCNDEHDFEVKDLERIYSQSGGVRTNSPAFPAVEKRKKEKELVKIRAGRYLALSSRLIELAERSKAAELSMTRTQAELNKLLEEVKKST